MSRDEIAKKLAEFINVWPLYSPFELRLDSPIAAPPGLPETILRDCSVCDATPTWMKEPPVAGGGSPEYGGFGSVVAYTCTHCRKEQVRVWLHSDAYYAKVPGSQVQAVERRVFRKLGQWPPQRIEPDREVSKQLSEPLLDLFKKGLTSLAHGYGIGALAYFRRVVEDAAPQVIDLFVERAEADDDFQTALAIRAAKDARRIEDRLRVASDALPPNLRPGGVNPLSILYSHYSRGIHGLGDDECLAVAQQLLFAMEYIFVSWRKQMDDAAKFRRTVQKWSDPSVPRQG